MIDAYAAGLKDADTKVDLNLVRFGVVANLVIRSAFTALPVELLGEPPTDELRKLFARRAGYARFLTDLGIALASDLRARV